MPLKSQGDKSMLDWVDDVPGDIVDEMKKRYDELTHLQQEQTQMGTVVPQLYGSLSRFIANPSTVSVETYKRMLDTDEVIGSGIDFMNLALIARFGDYTHPLPKIQEFVRRAIDQMEGSWHGNLDEMFSAEWSGFSLTEQVWKYTDDFDGAPAFVPQKLVTYPPLTLVFAVNRHGEVLPDGIYQYQRFHNTFFNSYYTSTIGQPNGFRPDTLASIGDFPYPVRIAADLTYLTVKIPKDKVIHLRSSSTGKFDNPYGRSILRRAYKSWVMKDAFLKMMLVAADRKGTPLVVGYAAPNDTVLSQTEQKEGVFNRDAQPQRADQAMATAFKNIHNSTFMVLPGRKDEIFSVEAIQTQGDMTIFKDALAYFNQEMMKAMLIPPLLMTGGDGAGSYALSDTHKQMFNKIIDGKLKPYKQSILDSFIKKVIAYNFPRDMWEKHGVGDFTLQETDPEMMEKLANVYGVLTTNGYMSPEAQEDLDYVRKTMNMPKKKAEAMYSETLDNENPEDPNAAKDKLPGKEEDKSQPDKKEKPEDDEEEAPPDYRVD